MTLNDLKQAYLSRHRMSLDDSAIAHLHGFTAFVVEVLEAMEPAEAPTAMPSVAAALAPADGAGTEPVAATTTETTTYPDGTVATGPGPLPGESPTAQAAEPAATGTVEPDADQPKATEPAASTADSAAPPA